MPRETHLDQLKRALRRFNEFALTVIEESPKLTRKDVQGMLSGRNGPYHLVTVYRKLSGHMSWTLQDAKGFLSATKSRKRFSEWYASEEELGDGR